MWFGQKARAERQNRLTSIFEKFALSLSLSVQLILRLSGKAPLIKDTENLDDPRIDLEKILLIKDGLYCYS